MCGICGIVAFDSRADAGAVAAMVASLAHRGPNGSGVVSGEGYSLGATRLAVLDRTDAAAQPFVSADERYVLVFNGEIYNYLELRRELEADGARFRSEGDTEVVLEAFRRWGDACVSRFIGMWAFVIVDRVTQRAFGSRDRFGIKPFYYLSDESRLVFGSEPKAFAASGLLRREANERTVARYLAQGWLDEGGDTFFGDLSRLEPAHNLVFDNGRRRISRYWSPEPAQRATSTSELRGAFLDSVRFHLRSDVSVGACLSGGIDSSAVVSAVSRLVGTAEAKQVGAQLQTFTAYFEGNRLDERRYASAVVASTNAAPTWITFESTRLVDDLQRIVTSQDEPCGSPSVAAQWYVMQAAAGAGVTVMLDGQGADEAFAGYRAQLGAAASTLARRGRLVAATRVSSALLAREGAAAGITALAQPFVPSGARVRARARARSGGLLHPRLSGHLRDDDGTDRSFFAQRLRLLTSRGLPELLRYEDRNSMAHSIEARVPFLDHRLVELALALPLTDLVRGGVPKAALREALRGLVPDVVLRRRDKVGFETPTAAWLRNGLGALAGEVLGSPGIRERGFIDQSTALRLLGRHKNGSADASLPLWRAVNLELWAREFLDR